MFYAKCVATLSVGLVWSQGHACYVAQQLAAAGKGSKSVGMLWQWQWLVNMAQPVLFGIWVPRFDLSSELLLSGVFLRSDLDHWCQSGTVHRVFDLSPFVVRNQSSCCDHSVKGQTSTKACVLLMQTNNTMDRVGLSIFRWRICFYCSAIVAWRVE
jgi:hypothetical protein